MATQKPRVRVSGGLIKSIRLEPGTTLAGYAGQTLTLAQLGSLLNVPPPPAPVKGSAAGGAPASLIPGPGLSGGGTLVGPVRIGLSAPVPAFLWEDEGGGGEDGPPGTRGVDGATGAPGPMGVPAYLAAEDGEDGAPGPPGGVGPSGAVGLTGPAGPPYFVPAEDGEDGTDGPPGRQGVDGSAGPTGAPGPPGPALFMLAEDGADGEPGPPGAQGSGGSSPAVTPIPLTVPGLVNWMDGSVLGNAMPGAALYTLPSRIPSRGAEAYLTQGTNNPGGNSCATVVANALNGNSAVNFPPNAAYAFGVCPVLATATVFLVFSLNVVGIIQSIVGGARGGLLVRCEPSNVLSLHSDYVIGIGQSTQVLAVSTWYQATITYDASTGAYAFRVNGTAAGSGTNVVAIANPTVGIGADFGSGVGYQLNGQLADVLVYNSVLTSAQIATIEGYLSTKWGV